MNKVIKVNIKILSEEFELELPSTKEEEYARRAATELNELYTELKQKYADQTHESLCSTVALNLGIRNVKLRKELEENRLEVQRLNNMLESYLKKINK